ncbi:MAG: anthranilate phosphoribosyltransferase [Actinomycetota bacterium]|nr:anthranilate phosphoribosyltransferase [Actinomycetota bacterium]
MPVGVPSWSGLLTSLIAGKDLTREDTVWAMDQVMNGEASPARLAGFLVALRSKGESVDELAGLAEAMLRHAVRIEVPGRCVDIVGTGGDRHHTVNISTMAALVVAGAGYRVVKHGNRSASSSSGAADVLEVLGVRLDHSPRRVAELAVEAGITFCFAQVFHPAMRHAGTVRSELGVPTAFNFLGPLTNPAQPGASAIGVYDERMAALVAGVLATRPGHALVFRGEDGLDELSTTAPSKIWTVSSGRVTTSVLDATSLGLRRVTLADLRGGDAAHNAVVVRDVLAGRAGPVRDSVLLNAAAAIVAADAADPTGAADHADAADPTGDTGLEARLAEAMARAESSIDSGAAAGALDRWVAASHG